MKNFILLAVVLSAISTFGQINPKTKWGQVSQEEINYTQVDFEKDAGAVILYETGLTRIQWGSYETTLYRRIKILNENGIEAANQEIKYYSYKNQEKILSIKAQTINFESGNPVLSEVGKDAYFDTQQNEFWSTRKFTFPNVKVGSIIEFEYKIEDKGINYIDAWRFQHKYPTLYSMYDIDNRSGALDFVSLAIGEQAVKLSERYKKSGIDKWELKNVPSYNKLKFVYNPVDASERVALQLKGYLNFDGDAMSHSSTYETVSTSWKEMNSQAYSEYIKYINPGVGKEIASGIADGKTELETLQNIYNHFKANYKWNNYYGIQPRKTNREVVNTKTGNSADLNLLLHSILNGKGFKTDIILLSTRDNGKPVGNYPYLGQFDSLINLVTTSNGEKLFIDASDMTFDLGYAAIKNFNYMGLIVDGKNELFVELISPISTNQTVMNYAVKDQHFVQTRTEKRNGYFKQINRTIPQGIRPYNPILDAVDLRTDELNVQIKEEDQGQLERIQAKTVDFTNANFIAVRNPLKNLLSYYSMNEFSRERALEFDFPFHYKVSVVVDIPEGYNAEIPAGYDSQSTASYKDMGYSQSAEVRNGKLVLHVEFYLAKPTIQNKYKEIKSFFDKIILESNKSLLLKKS